MNHTHTYLVVWTLPHNVYESKSYHTKRQIILVMYENLMWYIYSAMSVKLYYLWSPALTCACMFLIKLNNVFFFCKNGSFLVFHSGKINTWQIWELGFGLWWSHVAFASPYQTYIPLPFDSGSIYTWALCLVSNWCEKIRFFFFRCFAFWDLIIGNLGMWVWFLNVDIFYIFLYIFFSVIMMIDDAKNQ